MYIGNVGAFCRYLVPGCRRVHPHRHRLHHTPLLPGANFPRQTLRRRHPCGLHQPYQRRPYLLSLFSCLFSGTGCFSFPRRRPGPSGIQYVSSLSALSGQLCRQQASHLYVPNGQLWNSSLLSRVYRFSAMSACSGGRSISGIISSGMLMLVERRRGLTWSIPKPS